MSDPPVSDTAAASDAPWPTSPPGVPGLRAGFPEVRGQPPPGHRFSHAAMVALLVVALAALTAILVVVAVVAPPAPPKPCPPLGCQSPPIGQLGATALQAGPILQLDQPKLYSNSQGFTVKIYPFFPGSTSYPGYQTFSDGITLSYPFKASYGGTAYLSVIGAPANGDTPEEIVAYEVSQIAPNAQVEYVMPEAYVGYQPGYGAAFETEVVSAEGQSTTYQIIAEAAVRNGFAIAVVADGASLGHVTPNSTWWDGHPSPAAISVAYMADTTVNSITFP